MRRLQDTSGHRSTRRLPARISISQSPTRTAELASCLTGACSSNGQKSGKRSETLTTLPLASGRPFVTGYYGWLTLGTSSTSDQGSRLESVEISYRLTRFGSMRYRLYQWVKNENKFYFILSEGGRRQYPYKYLFGPLCPQGSKGRFMPVHPSKRP